MRARPEPIQLEHLSDASFLGKLLVLLANVRLDWKVIARYKHSSSFGLVISNEGKKFDKNETRTFNILIESSTLHRLREMAEVKGDLTIDRIKCHFSHHLMISSFVSTAPRHSAF